MEVAACLQRGMSNRRTWSYLIICSREVQNIFSADDSFSKQKKRKHNEKKIV